MELLRIDRARYARHVVLREVRSASLAKILASLRLVTLGVEVSHVLYLVVTMPDLSLQAHTGHGARCSAV